MPSLSVSGEQLKISQSDVHLKVMRLSAASMPPDPFDEFRPSPGRIKCIINGGRGTPGGHRTPTPATRFRRYDSMINLVTDYHGKIGAEAMDKMSRALGEYL